MASTTHSHGVLPESEAFRFRLDPALAAAGQEGEWLVARVRLLVMALLLVTPAWKVILYPDVPIFVWGFGVTLFAALAAVSIWVALRRGLWRPWLGYVSSALDVSLVTSALVTFLFVGSPLIALNSKVTFEIYFLALVATSLRYDPRICAAIGFLAVAEYAGLWAFAAGRYDLHDPAYAAAGLYEPVDQLTRLILLVAATLLAFAIVRRAQRLLCLSVRDRLTGIYNRGQLDAALAYELSRAQRSGRPLAIALIDLDHFKRVNDERGHSAGDRVLIDVAARLLAGVRKTDLVARYGGEEFAVLFPETSCEVAARRVDALRAELAATPIRLANGAELRVTFSAGLAVTPDDGSEAPVILDCADTRLFAAKRAGRNRVHPLDRAPSLVGVRPAAAATRR